MSVHYFFTTAIMENTLRELKASLASYLLAFYASKDTRDEFVFCMDSLTVHGEFDEEGYAWIATNLENTRVYLHGDLSHENFWELMMKVTEEIEEKLTVLFDNVITTDKAQFMEMLKNA